MGLTRLTAARKLWLILQGFLGRLGMVTGTSAGLELAITIQEVKGKGWIASAPEVRATAQGDTEEEAKNNLRDLIRKYPELLEDLRTPGSARHHGVMTV